MPIITLTSDYGNLDHRVSAIKGSILQLNPDARIIDITHEIGAYNLIQTAYILRNAYCFRRQFFSQRPQKSFSKNGWALFHYSRQWIDEPHFF